METTMEAHAADSAIGNRWLRVPISHIEDLADAVKGAGLNSIQLSTTPVTGSLVFSERDGVACSSGKIGGRVALQGTLSRTMMTFGLGLELTPGSRQWLREVRSGDMGLFMPGDEHDALYSPGSLYVALTLSEERAQEIAACQGMDFSIHRFGGSALLPRRLSHAELLRLRGGFESLHTMNGIASDVDLEVLRAFIRLLGRSPRIRPQKPDYRGRQRIVRRCREYIAAHLHAPLPVETLAKAGGTSTRTLLRSFIEVLGEPPIEHVRRLRLHRIRRDLLDERPSGRTITDIANRWGVTELGRFAVRYRAMFGERPSETSGVPRRAAWLRAT
jgi:AraC-like DNA-binding protein